MFDSVSLLVANGHGPAAAEYPLWWVHAESERVRSRLNSELKSQTTLTLLAVAAATAQDKKQANKTFKALKKTLEKLDD